MGLSIVFSHLAETRQKPHMSAGLLAHVWANRGEPHFNSPEKFEFLRAFCFFCIVCLQFVIYGTIDVAIIALETDVASRKRNLGDGGAVLSLLYEAYGDVNRIYDDQIKADFAELYQALNGMPLQEMDWIVNPVCALCRDHERNGFIHGVQVGIRLAQEVQSTE